MDNRLEELRSRRAHHRARVSTVLMLIVVTALAIVFSAVPAAAQSDAARRSLTIEASKRRLIKRDVAMKTVFIANPEIADVQVKSPKVIYVTGKKPGETTLIAVDENDGV